MVAKVSHIQVKGAKNYISAQDTAVMLGITDNHLRVLRSAKKGPKFTKVGRTILYKQNDVNSYIAIIKQIKKLKEKV